MLGIPCSASAFISWACVSISRSEIIWRITLCLVKELSNSGKYHYVVSGKSRNNDREQRLRKIFRESVTSYTVAQNIIVIKTLPGLASAACSTLDSMHIETLAGTLAGDDTAFLAMKDNKAAEDFCHDIEEMF